MGASKLLEHYRTKERNRTYNAIFTLYYFGNVVFVTGLLGSISRSDLLELKMYLIGAEVDTVVYYRAKKNTVVIVTI